MWFERRRPRCAVRPGKAERTEVDELRHKVARLERALGRKTMEVEVAGGTLAGMGVRMRVARSRELVARGRPATLVARVAGTSRQAIYRRPGRPPAGERRPLGDVDRAVLDIARANPTESPGWSPPLAAGQLGGAVNRKRVQRLMREHRLLQPKRSEGRRRRPGVLRGHQAR